MYKMFKFNAITKFYIMKNIKDITISIFAIIGFVFILSSFNNQSKTQETHGTPESHVWEAIVVESTAQGQRVYLYNKATGEMRKYSKSFPGAKQKNNDGYTFVKMFEHTKE